MFKKIFCHTHYQKIFLGFFLIVVLIQMGKGQENQRIVSLIPSVTETLAALDLGDQIIGVSNYCNYPPEILDLPKLGGLIPDFERMTSLSPQLILADTYHQKWRNAFDRIQAKTAYLPAADVMNLEHTYQLIEEIGALVHSPLKANELILQLRQEIRDIEIKLEGRTKPRVLFESWPDPLMAPTHQSLLGKMIEAAGGQNLTAEFDGQTAKISHEWVILQDPEFIFHTGFIPSEIIAARPAWENLSAVKNDHVNLLDQDLFSRSGPRVALAIKTIANILHPDAFSSRKGL
jgi:iron complex transport system substrate-binding protein